MDPVSLFFILLIFAPVSVWAGLGALCLPFLVASILFLLVAFLLDVLKGAFGLGRWAVGLVPRLVRGDRVAICWAVVIVYFATPLVGECIIAFTH